MRAWKDNENKFKQLINVLRDPMDKDKKMETHTHDFVEIEYVLSGSGVQVINDIEYKVQRGDIIYLKKGDYHTYHTDKHIEILNIVFYYSVFEEMCNVLHAYSSHPETDFPTVFHLNGIDMNYVEDLLLRAEKEFDEEKSGYYHVLKSYLIILLIRLSRISADTASLKNRRFPEIVEYIDNNFNNAKIYNIAGYFGYSANYFSKYFKKNMGISYVEYINRKRLNKAIELLSTTDKTVDSICHEIGLNDKKHFYELFKKYIGKTPGEIRQSNNEL